jgi:hypothetical protein
VEAEVLLRVKSQGEHGRVTHQYQEVQRWT